MTAYPKTRQLAARADERLNKRAGWNQNTIQRDLSNLIEFGRVEVGWRESCGSTDPTMFSKREWDKVVKALKREGATIIEDSVKHGNSWATRGGGFWSSIVYTLEGAMQ